MQSDWFSWRGGEDTDTERGPVKTRGEDGHLQAEEGGLRHNHPADTWTLDFRLQRCKKKNFCCGALFWQL